MKTKNITHKDYKPKNKEEIEEIKRILKEVKEEDENLDLSELVKREPIDH